MIEGFVGYQGTGKTAATVASAIDLVEAGEYEAREGVGNVPIDFGYEGFQVVNNNKLLEIIMRMVDEEWEHHFVVMDEGDRVVPARLWKDIKQTRALLNLWQDEKLFNYIFTTYHPGTTLDVAARNAMQVCNVPSYEREEDAIDLYVADGLYGLELDDRIEPASEVFKRYNRWHRVR